MRFTRKSLILETTHRMHGMLEQGGVSGRVVAYPIESAVRVTGMTEQQLRSARETDICRGYSGVTIREVIEQCCVTGRVVRRGHRIQ